MKATHYSDYRKQIPFSGGVETRVVISGVASATVRSVIETPLEFVKVRQQTNTPWSFRSLYQVRPL
jgi:solute carrier family 25 carnitine/acylcarnitine transporter 20/29